MLVNLALLVLDKLLVLSHDVFKASAELLLDELFNRLDDVMIGGVCHIYLIDLRRFLESFGIYLGNFLTKVAGFKSLSSFWLGL